MERMTVLAIAGQTRRRYFRGLQGGRSHLPVPSSLLPFLLKHFMAPQFLFQTALLLSLLLLDIR
jgi:hypothetical protein